MNNLTELVTKAYNAFTLSTIAAASLLTKMVVWPNRVEAVLLDERTDQFIV